MPQPRTRSRSRLEPVAEEVEAAADRQAASGSRARSSRRSRSSEATSNARSPTSGFGSIASHPRAELKDVPAVEVLVQEHGVLRLPPRPRRNSTASSRSACSNGRPAPPRYGKARGPARGFSCERPEGAGRRRLPELRERTPAAISFASSSSTSHSAFPEGSARRAGARRSSSRARSRTAPAPSQHARASAPARSPAPGS